MNHAREFSVRAGPEAMDFDAVTAMLGSAYWSLGIGKEEVERGARNSALVVGAFTEDGRQVGYARAVSDKVRFAYVLDVFVRKEFRNRGAAKLMMKRILEAEELSEVYQWLLITRDAHELYEKLGFSVISRPNDWMEIRRPRKQPF